MGALRTAATAVVVTSLVGCQFYARGSTGAPKQSVRHGEPIAVRKDTLPGAGELLPDGRVRYIVAINELCHAPKLVDEQLVMSPAITPGGVTYFVASSIFMVGGVGLIAAGVLSKQEIGEQQQESRTAVTIAGVSALIVGAVLTGLGASRGRKQKQALAKGSGPVTTRPDGVDEVACKDPVAEIGTLELVTPWGTTATGTPDATGAVTFDVVWAADKFDPDAPTAESLIAAPWKVVATKPKIFTTWQPLGPQLPQALDIARAAKKNVANKTE